VSEPEWLACTDPKSMLAFVRGRVTDRRLRLFGCACVRNQTALIAEGTVRGAVELAERHADGEVDRDVVQRKYAAALDRLGRAMARCDRVERRVLIIAAAVPYSASGVAAGVAAGVVTWSTLRANAQYGAAAELAETERRRDRDRNFARPSGLSGGKRGKGRLRCSGASSATPSGPRGPSTRLGSLGRAAQCKSSPKPPATSDCCPQARSTQRGSASSPIPSETLAAPTPSCSAIYAGRGRMCGGCWALDLVLSK
jgi:hypothetical protein